MSGSAADVADAIARAFGPNEYPGDAWILGSSDGCEPADVVHPFRAHPDWRTLDAAFLDAHYTALSFFSEAGFRYFLPAFLQADLADQLQTADPVFHLTHGFAASEMTHEAGGRRFTFGFGRHGFVNPRRYGAMTSYDYARYRLSVFVREEAAAIVVFLEHVRERAGRETQHGAIDAALAEFWRARAATAPSRADEARYVADHAAWLRAVAEARRV